MEALLSAEELSGVLGIARNQIYRLTRRDEIPYFKAGKYYRYSASEVKAALHKGPILGGDNGEE